LIPDLRFKVVTATSWFFYTGSGLWRLEATYELSKLLFLKGMGSGRPSKISTFYIYNNLEVDMMLEIIILFHETGITIFSGGGHWVPSFISAYKRLGECEYGTL